MFILNIQDVRISNVPDPKNPDRQIARLSYLDRQYELLRTFSNSQLKLAQELGRHFDEQGKACLIVKHPQQYSVWMEQTIVVERVQPDEPPDTPLESVFRAQLWILDGLWTEVRELLGPERATAFGTEIIASIPSIRSLTYLSATIFMAKQSTQSLEIPILSAQHLAKLYQEMLRLGGKYLGKNYSSELMSDLRTGLPPQLQQEFQSWLKKQSS